MKGTPASLFENHLLLTHCYGTLGAGTWHTRPGSAGTNCSVVRACGKNSYTNCVAPSQCGERLEISLVCWKRSPRFVPGSCPLVCYNQEQILDFLLKSSTPCLDALLQGGVVEQLPSATLGLVCCVNSLSVCYEPKQRKIPNI